MNPSPIRPVTVKELSETLYEIARNNKNYEYRETLIYLALHQTLMVGFEAGIRLMLHEVGNEWTVVFIDIPTIGEVSWHIQAKDKEYEGYDTEEKLQRIQRFYNYYHK